jgi:hypothetical protein
MRPDGVAIVAAVLLTCALVSKARAQDAGRTSRDAGSPAAGTAASASAAAGDDGEEDLPPGHPAVESQDGTNPHAHAGGNGTMPGMFQPPEDVEQEDASLPPGTIAVDLHDADDKPVPNEVVNLGILINSVAKGDSRKHLQATTDDGGRAVFSHLELASNTAYRVSSGYQGGLFGAMPFQLQQAKAMHVVLHVYPVTHDIQQALIVAEATVAAEIRDDRIQVEEALTIYNLGRIAWQPDEVRLTLPDGYTAFNAQASMSDQGVDDVGGAGRLRGTFPPGRHSVDFRWQVPWAGDKDVDFAVGLPPHVAIARVMMPATAEIKLVAKGFPPAEVRHDSQGQSFLVTERRLRPDDPRLTTLDVGVHDLPSSGPGKTIASALTACCVAFGIAFAASGRQRRPSGAGRKSSRAALLDELLQLERARGAGEVGPKTYERVRREIIDALARTLVET